MQTIKIGYIDFWANFNPEEFLFTKILQKHYQIEITSQEPDFIFCSNFRREYLKYSCPRIYYSGEAVAPDFNVYDYAIGFDDISFGDRYLQYPLCLLDQDLWALASNKHLHAEKYMQEKDAFCSFVVSADGGPGNRRDELFDLICDYKTVSSGGRHRNNLPDGKGVQDKLLFQRRHKFSLTCENSSFKGYTTEKIIDAFAAGCIPIYWGDPDIAKFFNPASFINCLDYTNDYELVDRIKEIDNDDSLYLSMLQEPMLNSSSPLIHMADESYLEEFLLHIFSQSPENAYRRNSHFTRNGYFHERDIFRLNRMDENVLVKFAKNTKRSILGGKKIK